MIASNKHKAQVRAAMREATADPRRFHPPSLVCVAIETADRSFPHPCAAMYLNFSLEL